MMGRFPRYAVLLSLAMLLLAGCASLSPEIDPPKVSLDSFRSVPASSGSPRFEIKLRISNPNEKALNIVGISYGIELQDRELVSGVTNEVPTIAGYSEEVVTLYANLQLFQLLRLLADLGVERAADLSYRFSAKIDFSGLVPTQRIVEEGSISLN